MGRKDKINRMEEAEQQNIQAAMAYYEILRNIAISNIEWVGMPPEINLRYVESSLFYQGRVLFFKDIEYLFLRYMQGSEQDVYDEPTSFVVSTASGYYNEDLNIYNSVPVFANMTKVPENIVVSYYAQKLANIARKIDLNLAVCTSPYILTAPDELRLTVENAIAQRDSNQYAIVTRKGFQDIEINLFGVEALKNFISDKLYLMFEKTWNEALTYLGVPNLSVSKKERVLQDEVQRSQGGTIASRNSRLVQRQFGADKINRMFGLNISVKFRDTFQEAGMENVSRETSGDEKDGDFS